MSRFNQISNFQFQASYSYLPNSDLISSLSTDNGLLTTRSFEQNRNLLTLVENSVGTNVISSYAYANDALGRRVSAVWRAPQSLGNGGNGSAFDEMGPTIMKYAYNTRSEVIGAERFFGTDPQAPGAPVAGQNWDYAFDPIGNRQTAARDGDTEIYTANNLNQYTQRTVPGAAHVAGTAAEDATVTINRPSVSGISVEPVTRQGEYFHKKLLLDNAGHPDREAIEVIGVLAGAGTNGMDIVSAYTGFVWAAKSPETFTYDDDGNMLSDSLRQYEWDAENRLIAVTASNVVDGTLTRVEFTYDYMSRRVSKKVYSWNSGSWLMTTDSSFLYDSWNLLREITTATGLGSITDSYVWGLDLSGSLQGAGGIGGLLARYRSVHRYYDGQDVLVICHHPPGNPENKQTLRINESAWPAHQAHGDTLGACDGSSISNSAFLYTFDGNGNVSEVIGTVNCETVNCELRTVGHYEYSPFGELIAAVGPEAFDNPFRFSTKYFVDELGIGDWGRRWYIPPLGRWLSRDPIGERGGLNLYIALRNNPLSSYDIAGLIVSPDSRNMAAEPCTEWSGGTFGPYGYMEFDYNVTPSVSGGIGIPPWRKHHLTVSGSLSISLYVNIDNVGGMDPQNSGGCNHERRHAADVQADFNNMALKVNKFEGDYCVWECARDSRDYVTAYAAWRDAKKSLDICEGTIHCSPAELRRRKNVENEKEKSKREAHHAMGASCK